MLIFLKANSRPTFFVWLLIICLFIYIFQSVLILGISFYFLFVLFILWIVFFLIPYFLFLVLLILTHLLFQYYLFQYFIILSCALNLLFTFISSLEFRCFLTAYDSICSVPVCCGNSGKQRQSQQSSFLSEIYQAFPSHMHTGLCTIHQRWRQKPTRTVSTPVLYPR